MSAETTDAEVVSDADDSDGDEGKDPSKILRLKNPKLRLISDAGEAEDVEEEDSEESSDNGEEVGLLPSEIADGQLSPVDGLKSFNWGKPTRS